MTEKENLLCVFEKEMISKIYGFCRIKLNTVEDAEDLSQDICLEVLQAINAERQIENLNAFVWSVSNHMFYNWLRKKKHGTTAYLTDIIISDEDIESEYIFREQKNLLRRELSLMSGNYRRAVVMHYYDNLSCEEIGHLLGKSTGTVKWWLHDARIAIEKGMNTMREYGEKSYRPGKLSLSCTGNPGSNFEPMACAQRKSAQNILLAAYKSPLTITELCEELGISAPYIEDEVEYLVKNQLMKEVSKGKYQTDFVILPGNNPNPAKKIYATVFPEYYEKLVAFLESKKAILTEARFNTAGFTWERLLWVYIHIISDIAVNLYRYENNISVKYTDIPLRPNGGKWIALGFENGFGLDEKIKWEIYHVFDGPVQKTDKAFAQGFFHLWSGVDSSIFFGTPDEVFALCREIIKNNINVNDLNEEQKYLFSIALEKKLFVKTNSGFKQNYYYVDRSERMEIEKFAREFYSTVLPLIEHAWNIILDEYVSTVPKHLHWQMGNFLANHLNHLVTCSLHCACKNGDLSEPDENNKEWLSLFASE